MMTMNDILETWAKSGVELRVTGENSGKSEIVHVEGGNGDYCLTNGLDAEEYPDEAWILPIIKLVWCDDEIFISCRGDFFELEEIL